MTNEGRDPVGSVAEEAARLLGLFAAGLPDSALHAAGARAAGEPPPSHACPECGHDPHARTDPVCRVCPVCRVLAVVRAISPETLEKVADIVDLAGEALRGLAARQRGDGGGSRRGSSAWPGAAEDPDVHRWQPGPGFAAHGGAEANGSATNGSATNGSATNGSATNGSATNGSATNGSATNGSATNGGAATNGSGSPDTTRQWEPWPAPEAFDAEQEPTAAGPSESQDRL